jgi:Xaa-Pro dipeptidase
MARAKGGSLISRRRFLEASTLAAGAGTVSPLLAADTLDEKSATVPPSIAKLKSLRGHAKPVTAEERAQRQEKARELMREHGLDAIVLTQGTSLNYFTGIQWWGGERLFATVLTANGDPFYISPAFEEGRAREQITKGSNASNPDVRVWQEDESPYALFAQRLKERSLGTSKLGIEETVKFVFSQGIAAAAPQTEIRSATPITAGCRMVKTDLELERMRLASKVTLAAYEAAFRALKPGMTKPHAESLIEKAHSRLGFEGGADVQVGEYSAFPHGSVTPQVIREGTIVLVDGGCTVEGYASDITRTFVLGKASDKMKRVFDIVHQAQSAALAAARPGVECGAADAAARKVIVDAGYGPDYKYFTHRVGHGMGMDGHEWPYLVRGNQTKLAPHMTFSDEPGIYIRGEFGVRLEDDMHITAEGAELFTPQSSSLENPFA